VAGIPAQEAVAMSMVVVGGTSLLGAALHGRKGNFHPKATLLFTATGVAGAFGDSFLTHMVSSSKFVTRMCEPTTFAVRVSNSADLMPGIGP
jgi:uncharacterized membrane protein YfcA